MENVILRAPWRPKDLRDSEKQILRTRRSRPQDDVQAALIAASG
jgi:hypothetical protein